MNKITQDEWRKLLHLYVAGTDSCRVALMKPFEQDGYVFATDSHSLIRVSKKYVTDEYVNQAKTPDASRVIPECAPAFIIHLSSLQNAFARHKIDSSRMTVECTECDVEGGVKWRYIDSDGDEHTMFSACPCCHGTGQAPNGANKYFSVHGKIFLGTNLLKLYRVMQNLGIDETTVSIGRSGQHLFSLAPGVDVVIMPFNDDASFRTTPVKVKTNSI